MAKVYDVRAVTGTYQKDGEDKNRYMTIGAVLETKNGGLMLALDVIPTSWDGRAYLNDPIDFDNKDHQKTHEFNKRVSKDVVLDDIDDKPIDLSGIPF